jgi:hypothetical protein
VKYDVSTRKYVISRLTASNAWMAVTLSEIVN